MSDEELFDACVTVLGWVGTGAGVMVVVWLMVKIFLP